jgi:hypothetical protein
LGFEAATVEQFAFERGKEAFAHRVIESNRRLNPLRAARRPARNVYRRRTKYTG